MVLMLTENATVSLVLSTKEHQIRHHAFHQNLHLILFSLTLVIGCLKMSPMEAPLFRSPPPADSALQLRDDSLISANGRQ